jgi:acyl-coenzyme A thioesterase PaaI-like protein
MLCPLTDRGVALRWRVVGVPIQQGRMQQRWQVDIRRPQDDKLIARGQVRLQNIEATT